MLSGSKLAARRLQLYMTQEQLGRLVGVTGGNIRRIEASESSGMYLRQLPKLAEALKMTPDEVLAKLAPQPEPAPPSPAPPNPKRAKLDELRQKTAAILKPTPKGQPVQAAAVPLLGSVSAGPWMDRPEQARASAPTISFPLLEDLPEGAFALEVDGDSMTPTYRPGDRILLQPVTMAELVEGDDLVLQLHGGAAGDRASGSTFARLIQATPYHLYLEKLNKAHPDIELAAAEIIRAYRVIAWLRRPRG